MSGRTPDYVSVSNQEDAWTKYLHPTSTRLPSLPYSKLKARVCCSGFFVLSNPDVALVQSAERRRNESGPDEKALKMLKVLKVRMFISFSVKPILIIE